VAPPSRRHPSGPTLAQPGLAGVPGHTPALVAVDQDGNFVTYGAAHGGEHGEVIFDARATEAEFDRFETLRYSAQRRLRRLGGAAMYAK